MLDIHTSTAFFQLIDGGAFAGPENVLNKITSNLNGLTNLTALNAAPVVTPTSITYSDATGSLVLTGQGFSMNSEGELLGTLAGLTLTVGGTTVASASFTNAQYILNSGSTSLSLNGAFPTDITATGEMIGALFVALGGGDTTAAAAALAPYSISSLNITDGSAQIASVAISTSAVVVDISGYELTLNGTFPSNLGGLVPILVGLQAAFNGGSFDPDAYPGLALVDLTFKTPTGDTLLYTTGSFTIEDGELINKTIITGTNGPDVFDGTDFDDEVNVLGGNDSISGTAGNDTLRGGDGFDTLNGGEGHDVIEGGNGRNSVSMGVGADLYLDNGQGGDLGRDTVFGNQGNDTIQGGNGADSFYGGIDNDLIFGRLGNDMIFGGDGFDTIDSGNGFDVVYGGNGRDRVFMGAGGDKFFDNGQGGDLGRDTVYGNQGHDTIQGGNGDDLFFGGLDNDLIFGRLGNDKLFGEDGFDTLDAGAGNDTVNGGNGRDLASMGAGNDLYLDNAQGGDLGRDTVYGNQGNDTIQGGNGGDSFFGGLDDDLIFGRLGDDLLLGEAGFDTLNGGAGHDTMNGGADDDMLNGGIGNDELNGGAGFDTLDGGAGNDTLIGGGGDDAFVFRTDLGADVITDYQLYVSVLAFEEAIWGGGKSVEDVVSDFASVVGIDVVFDFGAGNSVTILGLGSTTDLAYDLDLI